MFKSYEHFKKATKTVFDKFKADRNLKLSEFRNLFVEQTQHHNIQTYAASFDNKSNSEKELIQSAQINTVSVIIIENKKILTKVDFIDNEVGVASAHAFYIAHAKQYAFENFPDPEFTLRIAEQDSYGIDKGFLELSRSRTMQIVYSTEYGLKDTDEHKNSEMNEWRILALDANNLPPLPPYKMSPLESHKRITVIKIKEQDIPKAKILFPSKISRDPNTRITDNKNNSQYLHIEKHVNNNTNKTISETIEYVISSFKGKKINKTHHKNSVIDAIRKSILFYLPSSRELINSIDNTELLLAINAYAEKFANEFDNKTELELSTRVWTQLSLDCDLLLF
jgi:hypothetical protein